MALSFSLQAKMLELKNGTRTIFIEEKSQWQLGKDLFGMPFIYFSPSHGGQSSNISFSDTGAKLNLDSSLLDKNTSDYQENKKQWAEQIEAQIISFDPFSVKTSARGHRVHEIGVQYKQQDKTYDEKSYYIECRGKIVFAKSLRLIENSSHGEDFKDLITQLDCSGV